MTYETEIRAINSRTEIKIQLEDYLDYLKIGDNIRFNYTFEKSNRHVTTLVEAKVVNIDHLLSYHNECSLIKFISIKLTSNTLFRLNNLLNNKEEENND